MTNLTYTPKQMEYADRLMDAFSKIPEDKICFFTIAMESLLLGAKMAESSNQEQKPAS